MKRLFKVFPTLLTAALLLLLFACNSDIQPGQQATQSTTVSGLTFLTIQPSAAHGSAAFTGRVASADRALVAARCSGRIEKLLVHEGDTVHTGTLLLKIIDNAAQQQWQAATAGLTAANADLAAARAQLDFTQKTADRYRQLRQHEAISVQEYDQVTTTLAVSKRHVTAVKAMVSNASAQQATAKQQLSYNQVMAPIGGRIAQILVEQGSTVAPGMPLIIIDRAGAKQIIGNLPESLAGKLTLGTRFRVEIPAIPQILSGTLSRIQPSSDLATRSFEIRLDLDNADILPTGLFARFSLETPLNVNGETEQILLLPSTAIVTKGQLTAVYLLQNDQLRYRLVRIGRHIDDQYEIISGLSTGDIVVVNGVEKAINGARVEN